MRDKGIAQTRPERRAVAVFGNTELEDARCKIRTANSEIGLRLLERLCLTAKAAH